MIATDPIPADPQGQRVDVTNALQILRPTLGDTAGVALYRLLRLVALEDIIGRGAAGTAYIAGKKLGNSLQLKSLEACPRRCCGGCSATRVFRRQENA